MHWLSPLFDIFKFGFPVLIQKFGTYLLGEILPPILQILAHYL